MKNLYGYFLVSSIISILCIVAQTEVIQIIRLVCCVINIGALRWNKYIPQGLLVHKLILLLCGVLTQQNESILQFLFDDYFIAVQLNNILLILMWRIFSTFGSLLLVYLKYQHQDSISLTSTVFLPLMYVLPFLIDQIQNYYENKQQPHAFQTSPKLTTRDYLKMKSRIEELDVLQMDFDANVSVDLNQLIRNIASNQDQKFVLQEITAFNEQVWKLRMNVMPIGICIISKELQPKFMNRTLINMIKKNFIFQPADNEQAIYDIFVNTIYFKRIDSGGTFDWPQSAMFKHEQRSSNHSDEDTYSLKELLSKLEEGALDRFIHERDQIIELFSAFESQKNNKQIFFDCRVLFQEKQNIDYMVIIQDFTKQNELSKLEEKNKFKTKIVQSFSHELRTPLNSATIFLRSAMREPNLHQIIKTQYLQPCISALKLQNHLINDIIDFSQINSKLLDLKFSTFRLQQIVDELTEQFKFQFEFKQLGLAFEISSPMSLPTEIKTDYQRLLQVLTNIIQNALKFSEKGYVLVKIVALEQNEIEFTILDEGVGFTRKQLTSIQQLINSEQSSASTVRSEQWQGFGLIICQMLLKYLSPINRNSIQISSDGFDSGAKVTFIISNHIASQTQEQAFGASRRAIPRMRSMPTLRAEYGLLICIKARSPSKILLSKTGEQEECDLSSFSIREVPGKIKRYELKHTSIEYLNTKSFVQNNRASSQRLSQKETGVSIPQVCCNIILSVDDEVFNQKSLQLLLSQQGLSVDIVFNGRQAIEKVLNPTKCSPQCSGYKLILMDCQMPIMDGWKTTRKLKEMMANQQIRQIPIIGLTAFTSNEDMEKCKEVGMTNVLHKPLDVGKFQQILSELRIF